MDKSKLYNEETFYSVFIQDILSCKEELIIESPYMTTYRINYLLPYLKQLLKKEVKVVIVTRHPADQDKYMAVQTLQLVKLLKNIGIKVYYCGKHHRKLIIIDRNVLYEGSLNVLSYSYSSELMRRISGREYANEMLSFTGLNKFV